MTDLAAAKAAARAAATALRARLHGADPEAARSAGVHAVAALGDAPVVAGYLPMRSEIDPRPAMLALLALGRRVCAPVVEGPGLSLRFRLWTPDAELGRGGLGEPHPAHGDWVEPDALLVPLLAFDAEGWRLGYGGGFYDRTLEALRARRPVTALGFAYAGQRVTAVPRGPADQRLDAVATEAGLLAAGRDRG